MYRDENEAPVGSSSKPSPIYGKDESGLNTLERCYTLSSPKHFLEVEFEVALEIS